MMRGALVVAVVLATAAVASAHSWLDCAKWIPKDPQALTDSSKRRWADADGVCQGYARRFQVGLKPFGKMDEVQFYRHYIQGSNQNSCRRNNGGYSASGSNEGPASPRSGAYAPNKDIYSKTYGSMAQVRSGETLCWRWPAKNHMVHVTSSTNMVYVNWDDVPNRSTEISQSELRKKRVATLQFNNCPVAGVPSSGDQTGVGSELRPCGGCFTVPQRAPGIYTVQWDWPFKSGDSETYTSCADIEVLASTTPTNCVVSAWTSYGTCSTNCGGGTRTRTRSITTPASGGGTACPTLSESESCNTQACTGDALSEHVVYDDTLREFTDWSWASTYNLKATSPVKVGSNSISWTPKSWDAIYLHYPTTGDLKDYQGISFWVHGGSTGGQSIWFSAVVSGSSSSTPLFKWNVPTSQIKANQWNQVNLTFSTLGKTSGFFDGIWFQANGAGTQGTLYLDEIYFMHVHEGGAAPVATDSCVGVTCGVNSKCVGGTCACTGGHGLDANDVCTIAPSITDVTVKTMAGVAVSAINGTEMLKISWSYTGSLATVSIVLESSASSVPDQIVSNLLNQAEYTWMVPTGLIPGTYTVRVFWSSAISGRSASLIKANPAEPSSCASPDCSGHGECDEDTDYVCICRYGFTGASCSVPPDGVIRLSGVIKVATSYADVTANLVKFAATFRSDMAAALVVLTDQIEPTAYARSGTGTQVSFDVLFGGQFRAPSLALTSNAALSAVLTSELTTDDSSLNRGTNSYAAADDLTSSASVTTASTAVVAATVLAAAVLF